MTSSSHTAMSYWKARCSEEAITGNYTHMEQGCSPQNLRHFLCPKRENNGTKPVRAEYIGLMDKVRIFGRPTMG